MNMVELNNSDALKYAIEHDMIDMSYVEQIAEMRIKREILENHPYKIWEGKDGYWHTYLKDNEKRISVKRKKEEDVEEIIIKHYQQQIFNPTVREVFEEWNDRRLELKKISEATHLRNEYIFNRHFSEVEEKKIKTITPEEIEDFLEEQIPKHNLKAKAFGNLKTVTRGMLLRAKKRKLINFNVSEIFENLDVSERDFESSNKDIAEEVYNEEETKLAINWLRMQDKTLVNLGVLLMFATGLRVGELAALKWSDWDGYLGLKIHRTETRYKLTGNRYKYLIRDYPKTPAGVRTVVLPPSCKWIIDEIRKLNPKGEFMFELNGKWIKTFNFRKLVYKMCSELGLTIKSPHKIRKTYASILLDNSIPENTVIEVMGHTDIRTTKRHYSRDRKSNAAKAQMLAKITEFDFIKMG